MNQEKLKVMRTWIRTCGEMRRKRRRISLSWRTVRKREMRRRKIWMSLRLKKILKRVTRTMRNGRGKRRRRKKKRSHRSLTTIRPTPSMEKMKRQRKEEEKEKEKEPQEFDDNQTDAEHGKDETAEERGGEGKRKGATGV